MKNFSHNSIYELRVHKVRKSFFQKLHAEKIKFIKVLFRCDREALLNCSITESNIMLKIE